MIRFSCPHCKSVFNAKNNKAGHQIACPRCQQGSAIPVPAAKQIDPRPFYSIRNGNSRNAVTANIHRSPNRYTLT